MIRCIKSSIVAFVLLFLGSLQGYAENTIPQLPAIPDDRALTVINENTSGEIYFKSRSPFDFDVLLNHINTAPVTTAQGRLYLPEGASSADRVPAMVILHGSGGLKPIREYHTAELLAKNGYAGLVLDYYAPRGYTEESAYRNKTAGVTEFDVVTDAYAALRALQNHPAIDGSRIGVMGFSYGGMATRLAMDDRIREQLASDIPPFSLHVDIYGPCYQDFRVKKTTGAPLLTLRGAYDASNNLVDCAREEERLRSAGSTVGVVIYATAGHSWELEYPKVKKNAPYINGCVIEYDDKGFPSRGDVQIIAPEADISRSARYKLRWLSGKHFQGCLGIGYIMGRDEEAREGAEAELLKFVQLHWEK